MIGVLALQGAFQKHADAIKDLGEEVLLVKTVEDLEKCDGLILPGGESTATLKLLNSELRSAIKTFQIDKPILGTCCGAILLANQVDRLPYPSLGGIDMEISRNAYGSQVDSFCGKIDLTIGAPIQGFFIRVPKILFCGLKMVKM